jgi:peptidoglycan hydrolase-like protein with peptidoglycan-binding domain
MNTLKIKATFIACTASIALAACGGSSSSTPVTNPQATTLVAVEKRDLATTSDVSGTLGFGDSSAVSLKSPQKFITALPDVGTIIKPGEALAEINGVATPYLFTGKRPAWRNFASGMNDGADVQQLEETLVALGVTTLTPDQTFDDKTTTAIKAWQNKIGATEDGVLSSSEIIFAPTAVRISGQQASVGDAASGAALLVTGITQVVSVSLDTSKAALAKVGEEVSVELADGSAVAGKITYVATTATTSQGQGQNAQSTTSIAVTVTLEKTIDAGDNTPVTVKLSSNTAVGVIAVPVKSLIALAEGGFAVERQRGSTQQLVGVTPGVFAGGWVEVKGEVQVGDKVVVPA